MSDAAGAEPVAGHAEAPPRAQRPSQRPATVLLALLFGVAALATPVLLDRIYDTANLVPPALETLARAPDVVVSAPPIAMPGIVVVVDGLRADEAERLHAFRRLRRDAAWGTVETFLPSLSRPFYHVLLTGVPPEGTGVRTNRFHAHARLDSLADRVREAGRPCAWIAEDLDWFYRMYGRRGEVSVSARFALDEPLDTALEATVDGNGPGLLVVHVLDVDESAHRSGIGSEDHRRALRVADGVLARVEAATRGRDLALLVASDHGHIDVGGHGGDEPEVTRAPWLLRAPTLRAGRVRPPLRATELGPTLAAWMGVAPPVSAVASPRAGLIPGPAPDGRGAAERSRLLAGATRNLLAELRTSRALLLVAVCVLALLGAAWLVTTFRTDAGTIATPIVWTLAVGAVHFGLWRRPLSLSAIDDIDRHAPRLAALGALVALVAIAALFAALRPWRAELTERGSQVAVTLRRSSFALGLHCLVVLGLAVAWTGGALGPWPLPSSALYAPILAGALAVGACSVVALVTLITALLPSALLRRVLARAGPAAGPGEVP